MRRLSLTEDGLSAFERDRLAILAMAGEYRVLDFIETIGFEDGYVPKAPYQSYTEHIFVVEDRGSFISLHHIPVTIGKRQMAQCRSP